MLLQGLVLTTIVSLEIIFHYVAARYGRSIAAQAVNIHAHTRGSSSLVAAGKSGVVVDHDASKTRLAMENRDKEMGNVGNCTQMEKVCWKWSGFSEALLDVEGKFLIRFFSLDHFGINYVRKHHSSVVFARNKMVKSGLGRHRNLHLLNAE